MFRPARRSPVHRPLRVVVAAVATATVAAALLALQSAFATAPLLSPSELRGGELVAVGDPAAGLPAATRLGTLVRVDATGPVARVELRQRFRNDGDHWREASYLLPLPSGAAVDALRVTIGARVIEGEIRAREAARAAFETARAEGRRAALVEQRRPNLFTAALTTIPPGAEVTVEVGWTAAVPFDDGVYELRLPLAVTPRYLPAETPPGDATVLDRPYREGIAPPLELDARIDAGVPLEQIFSTSHALTATPEAGGTAVRATLDAGRAGGARADRDLVVRWRPRLAAEPQLALFRETALGAEHLLALLLPPVPDAVPPRPREVVLVIDTSGSMAGPAMEQAKAASALALGRLGLRDRFNVIAFDDATVSLHAAPVPATPANLGPARRFVASLVADGGTEMAPALERALLGAPPPGFLRQVVFVTDGSVGNEDDLFRRIARDLGDARLFTVGIGSAPNAWFMREAAEAGRGSALFVGDGADVADAMRRLFEKLERPALTDLRLDAPAGAEVHPVTPPDLYAGEPLTLHVRLPDGAADAPLRVEGTLTGEPWHAEIDPAAARERPGPAALWARARIAALEEEQLLGADPDRVAADATELALDYGLVSDYTSLVAVERAQVRPEGADLVTAPLPEPLPAGQVFDAIFGYPDGATGARLWTLAGVALLALALLLPAGGRRRVGSVR